jgi:hypothetical protein
MKRWGNENCEDAPSRRPFPMIVAILPVTFPNTWPSRTGWGYRQTALQIRIIGPLHAMNKPSTQNRNLTIRQLWVVSKILQRMMFLQRHSLMGILTNPCVPEILSANPKCLVHNQNGFFCPLVNFYSGDVQTTSFLLTRWKTLISYRYNQASKTRIMRTPSSEPRTLVSFDFSPYNELIFRFNIFSFILGRFHAVCYMMSENLSAWPWAGSWIRYLFMLSKGDKETFTSHFFLSFFL